ncbi:Hpt domain-containing protein [Aureispira sp. CCB-QB1]|uniref:Hpt domain-containing protein n=1 Tax=Aureispira sp. CCB-QB1 TaxID=1313421 RepID=UPI000697EDC0|nr:Hpt domain-containing protein [Aureispira sp. CCB-QB1]
MNLTLDLTFLKEISDGDQDFINDVLHTFLDEMPKDMAQMNQAIMDKDIVMIGRMAHKTKSTLQTLGLFELKELALKIEQLAKQTPSDTNIIPLSQKFMGHIDRVYPNVKESLK